MLFTEYLESIEGTEQEDQFIEHVAKAREYFEHMPIKVIKAVAALGDYDSIADYKESEHYQNTFGWDVKVNLETGSLSIYPGAAKRKKALIVIVCIVVGIILLKKLFKGRRG